MNDFTLIQLVATQKEWLTRQEAAAYMGMTEDTFMRRVQMHLASRSLSRKIVFFSRSEIDQFIDSLGQDLEYDEWRQMSRFSRQVTNTSPSPQQRSDP